MSRYPCLGNQLWWENVKRGNGKLIAEEIVFNDVKVPPGYQTLPEAPHSYCGIQPVKPNSAKPHFPGTRVPGTQAPYQPAQKVKIAPFVDGLQPPPGRRPVAVDDNGCEIIDSVKGYVPPDQVSLRGGNKSNIVQKPYSRAAPLSGFSTLGDVNQPPPSSHHIPTPYPNTALNQQDAVPLHWRI